MAQEHLVKQWIDEMVNDLAQDAFFEVAAMSYIEVRNEQIRDKYLEDVCVEEVEKIALEVYEEEVGVEAERAAKAARRELRELSLKLLDSATLRHLCNRIATRGESLAVQASAERVVDRTMFSLVLNHAITSERAADSFRSNLANRYTLRQVLSSLLVEQLVSGFPWLDGVVEEETV